MEPLAASRCLPSGIPAHTTSRTGGRSEPFAVIYGHEVIFPAATDQMCAAAVGGGLSSASGLFRSIAKRRCGWLIEQEPADLRWWQKVAEDSGAIGSGSDRRNSRPDLVVICACRSPRGAGRVAIPARVLTNGAWTSRFAERISVPRRTHRKNPGASGCRRCCSRCSGTCSSGAWARGLTRFGAQLGLPKLGTCTISSREI